MMNVRRTMTEILLKVTNREIENICYEELQRHQKKYKGIVGVRASSCNFAFNKFTLIISSDLFELRLFSFK